MTYTLSFSPESIKHMAYFTGFDVLLSQEVQAAMHEGGDILTEAIRATMHWKSGTDGAGPLGQSVQPVLDSPYEVQVGTDSIYGHRRNAGFYGTDSLGRTYADEGAFFMEHGMELSERAVLAVLEAHVARALARLGKG